MYEVDHTGLKFKNGKLHLLVCCTLYSDPGVLVNVSSLKCDFHLFLPKNLRKVLQSLSIAIKDLTGCLL